MAAKPADQAASDLLLQYKTWTLKVSIHCEGCKRKVKKVLQGIEGVYKTDIDSQQHKVTVTGNVELDTLLKQLGRYGKHAELWPENLETKTKKKKKKKNKSNNGNGSQTQAGQEPSEDDKDDDGDHPPLAGKDNGDSGEEDDDNELLEGEGGETAGGDGTGPPPAGSGKKKKKKKKKAQNGENSPDPDAGHGPSEVSPLMMSHINPPPQQFYRPYGPALPMYYHHQPPAAPPPAAYGLSYSTVYPRASESYYARDPMHDRDHYASGYNNYRYVRPNNGGDEVYNLYDDDEGGCSIM